MAKKPKTETVRVELPQETFAYFDRVAELSGVPIEDVVSVCITMQCLRTLGVQSKAKRRKA